MNPNQHSWTLTVWGKIPIKKKWTDFQSELSVLAQRSNWVVQRLASAFKAVLTSSRRCSVGDLWDSFSATPSGWRCFKMFVTRTDMKSRIGEANSKWQPCSRSHRPIGGWLTREMNSQRNVWLNFRTPSHCTAATLLWTAPKPAPR